MMFKKEFYVDKELRSLLGYRNLEEGYKLEETRDLILKELKSTEPNEKFKYKNLDGWLQKYNAAILQSKEIGRVGSNKEFIKAKIIKIGFEFEDIKVDNLEMDKPIVDKVIGEGYNDYVRRFKFDLIGVKHIFYIYDTTCRARVISQILASWQYFLGKLNKVYDYIVIAPKFGDEYLLAFKAIELLGINIKNIKSVFDQNGLSFEKLDTDNWALNRDN